MKRKTNKKGMVLIISLLLITGILILVGAYFSNILSESRYARVEKAVIQAQNLADAGAANAYAELRIRSGVNLNANMLNVTNGALLTAYVTNNDPLGFLRDYGTNAPNPAFTVAGGEARLTINTMAGLNTGVNGSYAATLVVTAGANPINNGSVAYRFFYNYRIESIGTSNNFLTAIQKSVRLAQGSFFVDITRNNFARFALFTNNHTMQNGGLVWFTGNTQFSGPVSTNTRFSFAYNPQFSGGVVTQVDNLANYYNNGNTKSLANDHNGTIDVPNFSNGFQRNSPVNTLPTSVTQTEMRDQALGTLSVPSSNGVYVPNDGSCLTGGIYIRGDSNITLGSSGDSAVYTINRGGNISTITANYAANTTTVVDGSGTNTYCGLPKGAGGEGVLIYSASSINAISGTVNHNSNLTVAANNNAVISSHIRYEQYNTSPSLNASGYSNVLGLLSWNGNVEISSGAPNNIEIHGVVMAPNGVFTVQNYDSGAPKGIATLLGGVITDNYGAFGQFSGTTNTHGYGRNFVYDARMISGTAPPYFPYLTNYSATPTWTTRPIWQDMGG
ncbi:MAG: DUF4900 domain-containing protein [Candidatus Omnitrophica bacterium]|nr:DUF4900 domain-containing protein [Candidatus Omnitrophota bacterium]